MECDLYVVHMVQRGAHSNSFAYYVLIPYTNRITLNVIMDLQNQFYKKREYPADVVSFSKLGDVVQADAKNCAKLFTIHDMERLMK